MCVRARASVGFECLAPTQVSCSDPQPRKAEISVPVVFGEAGRRQCSEGDCPFVSKFPTPWTALSAP